MKKIKKFWSKLKGWQKGAVIGFLIPIVPLIIGALLTYILAPFITNKESFLLMQDIFYFPLTFFSWIFDLFIFKYIKCTNEVCGLGGYHMLITLFSPIIYAAIGAIIGFIITKIKK